jgi:RNA polymerase sigma factor FliA
VSCPSTAHAAVTEYRPLVQKIAGNIRRRLPACVEFDDLVQAGMESLIDARERFTSEHGASFDTYAGYRIRGAILDSVREGDWVPRSVHRARRDIAKAIAEIETKVGRDARAVEVAERLGLGIDEYHRLLGDIDSAHVEALDIGRIGGDPDGKRTAPIRAAYVASQGPTPEEALEGAESEEALSQAIKSLPERERFIIEAMYFEGLYLHEVGALLGLTESRICQLRTQAEARLRARLACAA